MVGIYLNQGALSSYLDKPKGLFLPLFLKLITKTHLDANTTVSSGPGSVFFLHLRLRCPPTYINGWFEENTCTRNQENQFVGTFVDFLRCQRTYTCYFLEDKRSIVGVLNNSPVWRGVHSSCFMEYRCFLVQLHLRLGIVLSLLADISYCKNFSSNFQELGGHKYITEAYFQKHESLIDQTFQDFIAYELSNGFCEMLQDKQNFVPELSVLHRHLIGEGSHRRLTSSIRIESEPEVLSKVPSLFCKAIIVERLPSGVFADPFELEHLTERGVFTDASTFGDTDLELPSVRANRSVVEVHMELGHISKNGWELNIELPLHARYAPLGEHGYTRVEFGSPDLFVRCIVEGDSHNQSCIFPSTNNGFRSTDAATVWEVPSGIVKHTKVVSVLTFISAVASAFSIFVACVYYSDSAVYSNRKQS